MFLKRGTKLGNRFITGGVIGSGGFGITYTAYDLKNEKTVAIKEYFPKTIAARKADGSVYPAEKSSEKIFAEGAEKFYQEAERIFQFNGNSNILSVFDYFYENNTAYLAMEYLSGITLENYIKNYGTLSVQQTVYIAERLSMALVIIHSAQLLHRDISPDNIMLCKDGRVKLIDFGAARIFTAENLPKFTVIMKSGFTPAEQYESNGNYGEWTDIYSLGTVLYYALTGKVPPDPYSRITGNESLDFGEKNDDSGLFRVIEKAAGISAEDRYGHASKLKNDIAALKITGEKINIPDDYNQFGHFAEDTENAVCGKNTGVKKIIFFAAEAAALAAAFIAGTHIGGGNAMEHLIPDATENTVFTENNGTVKIDFDAGFGDDFEYCGAIPVSVLESFGGDVKITVDFVMDTEGTETGFIPVDGSGKNVIEHLSTEMYPWADENGWIFVNGEELHYGMTVSREGVENLRGGSLGFETLNLAVKSVTLENGEKTGRYYMRDYSDFNAAAEKTVTENGEKIITADIAGSRIEFNGVNRASVSKSAFLEFDGDVLMTLEIEHIGGEDFQGFHVCNNGGLWKTLDGKIELKETVDRKKEKILLQYGEGAWIHPDIELSECSVIVPAEAVERMSGGIFFQEMNLKVKRVRLESACKEDGNGNASD
ncbi:MAG: serine/threonine protein kinase [Prevotella sp.]|nr:serine/threonine protein kinase [Prevotella sp.]